MVGVARSALFTGSVLLALLAFGCVAAPPGPRGPLRRERGVELAGDYSLAFSHARTVRPEGQPLSGTSDHYWSPLPLFAQRFEVRVSPPHPLEWMDFGADVGWVQGGVDLRIGRSSEGAPLWAGNVAVGVRTGHLALIDEVNAPASAWARLEAYPLLSSSEHRAVLAVGGHAGTFYHQVNFTAPPNGDAPGFDAVQVIRPEVRLELAGGFHYEGRRMSVLAAVEPYLVLHSGATREGACASCVSVPYEQSFGVVVVLRIAGLIAFRRPLNDEPEEEVEEPDNEVYEKWEP